MKGYEWVKEVKRKKGLKSDNQAAILLEIPRTMISQQKRGVSNTWSEERCIKIALTLEIEPALILADQAAERSKNPDVKKAWLSVAKNFAASFAAVTPALFVLSSSLDCILC